MAIHNCILERDPIDILPPSDDGIDVEDHGQLETEYLGWAEKDRANARHDQIAESCGMIIRECFESKICSCITLSPNNITLCFHCFTVQNTNTKKSVHGNHKVVASSLPILGSSSTTRNSFTTYFMSTNCFLTHNL